MSVHNGGEYLKETIESVLNQTFNDFEFLIINDCSTDKTASILKKYAEQDPRIKIIDNPKNIGLTKSLNKGINQARGEYIARIDSGDKWKKNKLFLQNKFLERHPETILLGTQATMADQGKNTITYTKYPTDDKNIRLWFLKGTNPFVHSSVIFKNNFFYNEKYYFAQDFELWSRLYFKGRLANLKQTLVEHQILLDSVSYKHRADQVYLNFFIYHNFINNLRGKTIKQKFPNSKKTYSNPIFIHFYRKGYQLKPNLPFFYKIFILMAYISSPIIFLGQLHYKIFAHINFYRYKYKYKNE